MKWYNSFLQLITRFRHPVSLPEEVAEALGIQFSNLQPFESLFTHLTCPSCTPRRLHKFMLREKAEEAFQHALRKERFHNTSLFYYYFNGHWLEFRLQFDDESMLRRLYVQHRRIKHDSGLEIPLYALPALGCR